MPHPSHRLLTPAECLAQDPDSTQHDRGTCNICDGGLAFCVFCKGGESELDTPCRSPLATLKAMLRCPGIDTTDQETGSTFRDLIIDAITTPEHPKDQTPENWAWQIRMMGEDRRACYRSLLAEQSRYAKLHAELKKAEANASKWQSTADGYCKKMNRAIEACDRLKQAIEKNGSWDDGCFYYDGRSASELQSPLEEAEDAIAIVKPK